MSASKCGDSSGLTRTTSNLRPVVPARSSQAATALRASALRGSATASSRSNESPSAGPASALSKSSGREPGTKSLLRICI